MRSRLSDYSILEVRSRIQKQSIINQIHTYFMYKFTVKGQPVPYKRTTQAAKFCAKYKVYQEYKDCVVAAFLSQCVGTWGYPKPLTSIKGQKTRVDIMIYFKNYAHGDGDNVLKAILDSLFANDKFCTGSYDYDYDKENPRVEITIS